MIYRIFSLLSAIAIFSITSAFASEIPKKTFHLDEKFEKEWGYAQAVRIGDTLYVSGSVGQGR